MRKSWKEPSAIRSRIMRQVGHAVNNVNRYEKDTQKYTTGELLDAASKLVTKVLVPAQMRNTLELVTVYADKHGEKDLFNKVKNQRDVGVPINDYEDYSKAPEGWSLDPALGHGYDQRDLLCRAAGLIIAEIERRDTQLYDLGDYGLDVLDKQDMDDTKKTKTINEKHNQKMFRELYKEQEPVDIYQQGAYATGSQIQPMSLNNVTPSP